MEILALAVDTKTPSPLVNSNLLSSLPAFKMGNASSRSTKTKSIPNGETIGGGMARGKTVEKKGQEVATHKIELVVEEFPSDESYLAEESDMSSSDDEEDEEEEEGMWFVLCVVDCTVKCCR